MCQSVGASEMNRSKPAAMTFVSVVTSLRMSPLRSISMGGSITVCHPSPVVNTAQTDNGAPVPSDSSAGPAGSNRGAPNISTRTPRRLKSRSATSAMMWFSERSRTSCSATRVPSISGTMPIPSARRCRRKSSNTDFGLSSSATAVNR